jgi:hypothetical protein
MDRKLVDFYSAKNEAMAKVHQMFDGRDFTDRAVGGCQIFIVFLGHGGE